MHTLVRASDPITSVRAAEAAARFGAGHCARILAALNEQGPSTAHELQESTGLTVVQLDRRLPELMRAGKARVQVMNGEAVVRGNARVWEAV